MKIAIIGYGKMGQTIERLALAKGHQVVLKVNDENLADFTPDNLQKADVAIEFSTPATAFDNVTACFRAGVPVVCGTTAWLDKLPAAMSICLAEKTAFLYASNFSIGVNLFFALSRQLASLMDNQIQYDVTMEEVHHTQKLDAPSGTAVSLANDILRVLERKTKWVNQQTTIREELGIVSRRIDSVPGTHIVTWSSKDDTIEIKHTAHTREGFAAGALTAAEWIIGKTGCFEMKDMLGF